MYRDLYGDAMLVLIRMSTNMADGNQQKHLLPSFTYRSVNLFFEKLVKIKVKYMNCLDRKISWNKSFF